MAIAEEGGHQTQNGVLWEGVGEVTCVPVMH